MKLCNNEEVFSMRNYDINILYHYFRHLNSTTELPSYNIYASDAAHSGTIKRNT